MRRLRKFLIVIAVFPALLFVTYYLGTRTSFALDVSPGDRIDEFNGVAVYYNGGINQTHGRNLSADGYNIGLRYQCVEFVKRYYFERFGHKMPDSYGHAKSFFDPLVADGALNPARALLQYRNGSATAPQAEDLIVFAPTAFNPYGHVAIVTEVSADSIGIIQQNVGKTTREKFPLANKEGGFFVDDSRVYGWLRMP